MLTALESRILSFIRHYRLTHGHSPLLKEIGEAVGIVSKGTLHRYLRSLVSKGCLEAGQRGWRNAKPVDSEDHASALPLLGRIAAGRPIEAIAGQDQVNLQEMLGGPGRFVLQVKGDSMVEAGICDGDMVIIRQQDAAREGDIVVALIDNEETTLKRLHFEAGGKIVLIPENRALSALVYTPERVRIQGVLVGLARRYL